MKVITWTHFIRWAEVCYILDRPARLRKNWTGCHWTQIWILAEIVFGWSPRKHHWIETAVHHERFCSPSELKLVTLLVRFLFLLQTRLLKEIIYYMFFGMRFILHPSSLKYRSRKRCSKVLWAWMHEQESLQDRSEQLWMKCSIACVIFSTGVCNNSRLDRVNIDSETNLGNPLSA